ATGARTALLGGAAGALLVLFKMGHRWVTAAVPAGLVALLLTAIPAGKVDQVIDLWQSDAFLARLQVWSSYWGVIRESPLGGAGLGLLSTAQQYALQYGLNLYYT